MKKLLLTVLLLTSVAHAAGTYTEAVTKKYTQPIVDKETKLRQEAQARQDAAAKTKQDRQNAQAIEAQRRIDTVNATKQKVNKKQQLLKELVSPY